MTDYYERVKEKVPGFTQEDYESVLEEVDVPALALSEVISQRLRGGEYEFSDVDPAWKSIPYGRPTANNRYFVVDAPRPKIGDCPALCFRR